MFVFVFLEGREPTSEFKGDRVSFIRNITKNHQNFTAYILAEV